MAFDTNRVEVEPRGDDKVAKFVNETLGLRPLTETELRGVSRRYRAALRTGGMGNPEGELPLMVDTGLPLVPDRQLPVGKIALVLDVGGTNWRAYLGRVEQGGEIKGIVSWSHRIETETNGGHDKVEFNSADEFYDLVVERTVAHLGGEVTRHKPDCVGIVWCFPGQAFKRQGGVGVDIRVPEAELRDKGFVIHGLNRMSVSEAILGRLERDFDLSGLPVAVMNDTRAAEGGVVGTGTNLLAIFYDESTGRFVCFNTQSGSFRGIAEPGQEPPLIYRLVDGASTNPGETLGSKQIAGKWLGLLMAQAAEQLWRSGLLERQVPSWHHASEFMHILLSSPELLVGDYSSADLGALQMVAVNARERSAQLFGAMVAEVIKACPEYYEDDVVKFPVEGSVFWNMGGYADVAKRSTDLGLNEVGKKVRFIEVSGLKGAARAALNLLCNTG